MPVPIKVTLPVKARAVPCKSMPASSTSRPAPLRSTPALPVYPPRPHPGSSWITVLPFSRHQIYLGNMAAAANHTWLQHARIEVLVRCEPGGLDQPQHCPGAIEIGWWFTKDFCSWVAFKGEAERKSEAVAKALEGGRQNIMFWCNDGHLRSPAALACFLL